MGPIIVKTPVGVGQVWGIAPGKVLVEFDYMYLVEFDLEEIKEASICKSLSGGENVYD